MCWTEDVCHEAWEGAHGLDGKKKFGVQNKTKSTKVKNSGREAIGGGAARRVRDRQDLVRFGHIWISN